MPPHFPYDRSQFAGPVFTAVAHPAPRSSTPVSSYTSLDHALGPQGARGSNNTVYQPPSHLPQPSHMASDGRYVYHSPQEVPAPYGYPAYAAPYEHPQYAQNMSRPPVRSASSQAHSPHQPPQPYSTSPPGYPPQPPYGPPTAYGVAPPPAGPWNNEGWSHYPHPYPAPHPPGQEGPYSSNGTRPDVPASEHRSYQPGPPRADSHRTDERPSRPAEAAPQVKVRKTKENEPPTAAPAPAPPRSPPLGLDLVKLMEQYRIILDASATLIHDGASRMVIPPDTMESMVQAATFGAQALESAGKRVVQVDVQRPPRERTPEESEENTKPRQPPENQPGSEGQTCLGCSATSTPEWRRGPMGPRTLCNACGLVYAKLIKKRNRDGTRTRGQYPGSRSGAHNLVDDSAAVSSGEGGSDDEDSYGSQDRRSDGGFHGGRD